MSAAARPVAATRVLEKTFISGHVPRSGDRHSKRPWVGSIPMPDAILLSNWIGSTYLSFVRSSVCSTVDEAARNPQMRGTASPTQSFPDDTGCKRGNIIDLKLL